MSTLERAIVIAAEAHAGQTDKAGAPYLLHTLRVMMAMTTIEERIVAALHDVVEDCYEWTLDRIRSEGFSETIVEALDSVTKRADEVDRNGYFAFVRRAGLNAIGRQVKLADLRDNLDLTRIRNPTQSDFDRIEKYCRAFEILEETDKSHNAS